jgi:myo-inositol-1(or 4)-monophosphatase
MNEYKEIRETAARLAKKAGDYVVAVKGDIQITKQKDLVDICTTADLGSEKILIDGIKEKYPEHSIYSEEAGQDNSASEYRWIIDPIDGTKEYIRAIPLFNISIAIEHKGSLVAAVVYRPTDNSLYSASFGDGAYLNGQKISVSSVNDLSKAFVYTYMPSFFRNPKIYKESWDRLGKLGESVYRLRSLADENTMLCWLAQGGHEAYINISNPPKWYDVAPGLFIAKEAGAYIPEMDMENIKKGACNSIIITNQDTIYDQIKSIIHRS